MPPKKKKRKTKQPTQRQSQKQIVNINFAEKKKRKKRRPQVKQSVKKDNLQMAVQSLSSNLNMFSSDTQRLNNLENLITELRREQRQPISTGVITPTQITSSSVMETQTEPTLKKTQKTQTKKIPILTPDIEAPLIPTKSPKPAPVIEKEEGDLADLLNPNKPFVREYGEQEPIKSIKEKLQVKIKKKAKASAEKLRPNTTAEIIEGGGEDIPIKSRKISNTKGRRADKLFNTTLMSKAFEGFKIRDNAADLLSSGYDETPIMMEARKLRQKMERINVGDLEMAQLEYPTSFI